MKRPLVVSTIPVLAILSLGLTPTAAAQEVERSAGADAAASSTPEDRWPSAEASDRLFAGPTGRTLPAGTGYVGVIELFFPNVTYGLTDRVQIGGGVPVIPEVALEAIYVTAKVGLVDAEPVAISAGTVTFLAAEGGGSAVGALYGAGTFGGEEGGLTLGAGFPFLAAGEDSGFADEAVLLVGGDWRVGESAALLTESYLVPGESAGVTSVGARLHGERFAVDLGVGAYWEDRGEFSSDFVCCLPIVNVTWAFGGDDER
ncbi:MAG: hypothetical protein R3326_09935 [Gemmatimonadota bacterium]|nr:hypothetical protein [Gemmatimonadota bacterium]